MKIAVVTGASSGMGLSFLYALDKDEHFDEIWAIARRSDRLDAISGTRAKIKAISLDLSDRKNHSAYKELLKEEKPDVAVLVNAAGFGRFGSFTDVSLDDQYGMTDLNAAALMAITYITLPFMKRGGRIYELDSLSAFQPVPYMAVYAATKAYVLSLSRSLNVELKPRGIRIMAVCPGWVRTEFFDRAKTDDTITYFNKFFEPKDVASRALRDMKMGRDVSVLGASIKTQVFFTKLLPHKIVMTIWCRQQKK